MDKLKRPYLWLGRLFLSSQKAMVYSWIFLPSQVFAPDLPLAAETVPECKVHPAYPDPLYKRRKRTMQSRRAVVTISRFVFLCPCPVPHSGWRIFCRFRIAVSTESLDGTLLGIFQHRGWLGIVNPCSPGRYEAAPGGNERVGDGGGANGMGRDSTGAVELAGRGEISSDGSQGNSSKPSSAITSGLSWLAWTDRYSSSSA
jgi:hypothetical protein